MLRSYCSNGNAALEYFNWPITFSLFLKTKRKICWILFKHLFYWDNKEEDVLSLLLLLLHFFFYISTVKPFEYELERTSYLPPLMGTNWIVCKPLDSEVFPKMVSSTVGIWSTNNDIKWLHFRLQCLSPPHPAPPPFPPNLPWFPVHPNLHTSVHLLLHWCCKYKVLYRGKKNKWL